MTAVLWDADGVLQRVSVADGEESMRPAVEGRVEDVEGFLEEAYWAERPALAGEASWLDVLPGLLERWGIADSYDQVLRGWLSIEPVAATHDLLRALREAGLRCYLATNQAEHRGVHMRDEMGYAELFDGAFYSYEMGVAKPDPDYFRFIVDALGIAADEMLFLDDRPDNVDSARSVGMRAEVWSYREDLSVLHDHLARHGVDVPQLPSADGAGRSGVS
ncbi:MAG TPA: HAD-IA family hydrolase [Nocardioidaceae bacterium]|nr:HAD-IA family hydrolase [Nocardioidaceae bacterium]